MDVKQQVLFVDDDPNFLQGIRLLLRGERKIWNLSFANGGREALEMVANTEYDCIVSDVSMPEMTGLEFLERLREREQTQNTPVIILTGNAEADLKRKALDLGATDLLSKPVTYEDLLARIRSVLNLKSYQDELRDYNELLEEKVRARTVALQRAQRDIILRLAKAGELRDEETGHHVVRVACFSRALGIALKLEPSTIENIFFTSPLHDIGKIGIPDSILLKPSGLSDLERAVIETHCEIGANILLEEPKGHSMFLEVAGAHDFTPDDAVGLDPRRVAAEIAWTHHEWWDGTGYPKKLSGTNIPISGRIVALADVYDALRSRRPYKLAIPHDETIDMMREQKGTHFAPDIFEALLTVQDEFCEIRDRYEDPERHR